MASASFRKFMVPKQTAGEFFKPVTDFGNGFFIVHSGEPKVIEIYTNEAFITFCVIYQQLLMRCFFGLQDVNQWRRCKAWPKEIFSLGVTFCEKNFLGRTSFVGWSRLIRNISKLFFCEPIAFLSRLIDFSDDKLTCKSLARDGKSYLQPWLSQSDEVIYRSFWGRGSNP